jgi:hypothetical protein
MEKKAIKTITMGEKRVFENAEKYLQGLCFLNDETLYNLSRSSSSSKFKFCPVRSDFDKFSSVTLGKNCSCYSPITCRSQSKRNLEMLGIDDEQHYEGETSTCLFDLINHD